VLEKPDLSHEAGSGVFVGVAMAVAAGLASSTQPMAMRYAGGLDALE